MTKSFFCEKSFYIGKKLVGNNCPPYIVAELSANHKQDIKIAKLLIEKAYESGADAVKLQTYTADTITLNCKSEIFKIKSNSPWKGRYFYDLYKDAHTPWEWHKELYDFAQNLGLELFSSPFDESAVDFLEKSINPCVYKIASFEITHTPLLAYVAKTKKPVILSTGMSSVREIKTAIETLQENGCSKIILLKCISSYPANPKEFNLNSILTLKKKFNCLVGLSDHSLENYICIGSVAMGACLIEKHIVLDKNSNAIDESFSLTPQEFREMVKFVKNIYDSLGSCKIMTAKQEEKYLSDRRSIFVSKNISKGETISSENIKIIRPGFGLSPDKWFAILGKKASKNLSFGKPLEISDVEF